MKKGKEKKRNDQWWFMFIMMQMWTHTFVPIGTPFCIIGLKAHHKLKPTPLVGFVKKKLCIIQSLSWAQDRLITRGIESLGISSGRTATKVLLYFGSQFVPAADLGHKGLWLLEPSRRVGVRLVCKTSTSADTRAVSVVSTGGRGSWRQFLLAKSRVGRFTRKSGLSIIRQDSPPPREGVGAGFGGFKLYSEHTCLHGWCYITKSS